MTPPAAPSALVPSRYALVGRRTWRDASGRRVRPVYHSATTRTFLIDEATAECLAAGRTPAYGISELASLGLLVPRDRDEAAEVIAAGQAARRTNTTRRFVIMPTAYCNMGCTYCGQEHRRGTDAGRHRDQIVARVEAAVTSGRYDTADVRWFGAEPLMGYAVLRDLSRRFVALADRHGVRYSSKLVTNGVLLDGRKLAALAGECRVGTIEVTIDGPPAAHDASRPLKSGQSSYHRIVAAIRGALDDPELDQLRFRVRTNIGVNNAGQAAGFAAAMRDAGLAHPRVFFYPAPVHPWGNDVSRVAVSYQELARVELTWLAAYLAHGLTCGLLPTGTASLVCVAVDPHSEVIAPDGRIYSCTEQPLVPGSEDREVAQLGSLPPDQRRPDGDFDDWYDTVQSDETGCRTCRILPVCGGQCPKLWREGSAPCPTLKTNLPDRLDLYATSLGLVPA
ncbi:MAG: radical SAM protein [Micromonosporaceae bacterium]